MVRSALLLVFAVACLALAAPVPEGPPDLIGADLRIDEGNLVLEVQNQGPGTFPAGTTTKAKVSTVLKGKAASTEVDVPVPAGVFAVAEVRIPLQALGIADANDLKSPVTVRLDPERQLKDEYTANNKYQKQAGKTARKDYRDSKELPDLVVTDITADKTLVYVHYKNQGKGVTGADFLVKMSQGAKSFDGNASYRFVVPPPGQEVKSGGLSLNMLGLKSGATGEVTAVIDHEERVRETDRKNNTLTKKVTVP